MNRRIFACLLAVFAVLALAACGDTVIDNKKAESAIADQLKSDGVPSTSVTCPNDVKVEAGTEFSCSVMVKQNDKEVEYTLPLRVKDKDGTVVPTGKLTKAPTN